MKFLDLFAGVGGIRLGMEQAGHECVGWVEWDKFARKSYVAIHKPDSEFTEKDVNDVSSDKLPKADCWCFGFPCFVSGTKVATQDGLKNIEDITTKDYVLTIDGSFQRVLQTMIKTSNDIYQLKIQGQLDTKVTGNHPYYIRKKTKDGYAEPKWISVRDVVPGDFAMSYSIAGNEEKIITDEEAWLLGRYVADGYIQNGKRAHRANSYNHKTVFAIGAKKANEFRHHLNQYHATESSQGNVVKFIISNEHLMNLAISFKRGAANKELPTWVYGLDSQQRSLLINGAISGDGYLNKSGYTRYSTISKNLAISLQKLIEQTYGVGVSMFKTNPPKKTVIEGRTVNQRPYYTLQFKLNQVKTSYDNSNGIIWYPVNEVKKVDESHNVYNLEVENNHTYTANGVVVHNCQDISVAGKQGGFTNGKRSSLFFKVTGLIRELKEEDKPSYLFIENVKNLLSINKGWDFAKLLIEMDEIGYDVEWDVLDSAEVVPQHRERIFIIGHLRGRSTRKVFPIIREDRETNKTIKEVAKIYPNRHSSEGNSVLDTSGISHTVTAHSSKDTPKIRINQVGNISNSKSFNGNPQTGRVYGTDGISPTLNTMQGGGLEPKILDDQGRTKKRLKPRSVAPTLRSQSHGNEPKIAIPVSSPDIVNKSQHGRRFKENGDPEFSLTTRDRHGVLTDMNEPKNTYSEDKIKQVASSVKKYANVVRPNAEPSVRITNKHDIRGSRQDSRKSGLSELQFTNPSNKSNTVTASHAPKTWDKELRIRKLTPLECWRLQGFPDWAFNRAKDAGLSDSQLYKQAGNSVTVTVIKAIADKMEILNN